MFITALFIIARTWKQPRCPSANEWIRKLWYIYTMEYYSAVKRNSSESVLMRWMKLEPIIQSEVSQKDKFYFYFGVLSLFYDKQAFPCGTSAFPSCVVRGFLPSCSEGFSCCGAGALERVRVQQLWCVGSVASWLV